MGILTMARQRRLVIGLEVDSYTGLYEANAIDGTIKFLTGGVLTVKNSISIDAFLVGGGGAGRYGGGGGGYTKTARKIQLVAGEPYEIVIGEGGTPTQKTSSIEEIKDGNPTTAFGYTAAGGISAGQYPGETTRLRGGPGGSGGGAGTTSGSGADGGTNGADGGDKTAAGGDGQGYTTRAFGEEFGALYAAGGGGCPGSSSATPGAGGEPGAGDGASTTDADMSGAPNTGSGGGGTFSSTGRKSNGGSGIVIIRPTKAVGRQYLYAANDEHTGITLGWTGTAMNGSSGYTTTKRAPIITRGEGSIIADNTGNYGGVFHTAMGIDMTPYKTLVLEGTFRRMGRYTTGLRACVWSELSGYYANNILANTDSGDDEQNVDVHRIEVDVSAIDGAGIVGLGMSNAYAEVTACYLIPKDE